MPYNTVVTFSAGNTLAAADLNNNFANLDYLNAKINSQIQVGAGAMTPTASGGASPANHTMAGNSANYTFMDFPDTGSMVNAEFGLVLPSDYNGGTMTAIFYWTANSTSTNSVVWAIQAYAVADDGALGVSFGTPQAVADANKSTAYDLNITSATSGFTIAGTPTAGKWAYFRLYRASGHASDTLAATARLLSVVLTYTRS